MKQIPPEIKQLLEFKDDKGFEGAPRVLTKIIHLSKPCEDCNRDCVNRTLDIRVAFLPGKHWRTTCQTCKFMYNPKTKQYDIEPKKYSEVYYNTYGKFKGIQNDTEE